jgi:hypothetical protein
MIFVWAYVASPGIYLSRAFDCPKVRWPSWHVEQVLRSDFGKCTHQFASDSERSSRGLIRPSLGWDGNITDAEIDPLAIWAKVTIRKGPIHQTVGDRLICPHRFPHDGGQFSPDCPSCLVESREGSVSNTLEQEYYIRITGYSDRNPPRLVSRSFKRSQAGVCGGLRRNVGGERCEKLHFGR